MVKALNRLAPYFIIFLLVCVLYLLTMGFIYEYNEQYAPVNDPFRYTVSWFQALLMAHQSYWVTLGKAIAGSSWYQLQMCLISFLSPLMKLDPVSIALINFFSFLLATSSLYRLAHCLLNNRNQSLCCAFLFWLFPAFYDLRQSVGLYTLMLDTVFFNFLCIGISNLLIYVLRPEKMWNALFAALFIGLSVWGRGNSIFYVLISVFIPCIFIVRNLILDRSNRKKLAVIFSVFLLIGIFLASFYWYRHFNVIKGYYFPHSQITLDSGIHWYKIWILFINFPGYYFSSSYSCYTGVTILASLFFHFLVTLSFFICLKLNSLSKKVCFSGCAIYFGTFLFISAIAHKISVSDQGYILVNQSFHPMLLGLYFSLLPLAAHFLSKIRVNNLAVSIFLIAILAYGFSLTEKRISDFGKHSLPMVKDINYFSTHVDQLFPGCSIVFLWKGVYNEPIIDYYRIMNKLPMIPLINSYGRKFEATHFCGNYDSQLWVPSPHVNTAALKQTLEDLLTKVDVVIVPLTLSSYSTLEPYPLYRYKHLLAEAFESPCTPNFQVRMVLQEASSTLLVLQRSTTGSGDRIVPKNFLMHPKGMPSEWLNP